MGTPKRQRQRAARQAKLEAELAEAKKQKVKRTGLRFAVGAVILLVLLFGYSLLTRDSGGSDSTGSDETTTTSTIDEAEAEAYSDPDLAAEVLGRTPPDLAPPPSDLAADALEVTTVIEGTGEGAEAGDTVTAHYIGKTADDNVFDQSWERGQPFDVTLGAGQVIEGWDEGLIGSKIGERRRLEIGSEKAYGERGQGADIPPDAPLAFEVDIVDIQPGG